MSEFDRENEPFFQEIHRNHRRSSATQVVGYIVPQKEARDMAVKRAVESRADGAGALILSLCMPHLNGFCMYQSTPQYS